MKGMKYIYIYDCFKILLSMRGWFMLYFTFDLMIYMFTLQIFLRKNFDGLSNSIPMLKGKAKFSNITHKTL